MNKIIKYLKDNKNPKGSKNKYKSVKASKIASFFPPYVIQYEDDIYFKGASIVNYN